MERRAGGRRECCACLGKWHFVLDGAFSSVPSHSHCTVDVLFYCLEICSFYDLLATLILEISMLLLQSEDNITEN